MNHHISALMHCPGCRSSHLRSFPKPNRFCVRAVPLPYYEWECLDCGIRFPGMIKFDTAIDRLSTLGFTFSLLLLFFIVSSIQIYILSLSDRYILRAMLLTLPAAFACLLVMICAKIRIRMLRRARNTLIEKCYT